MFLQISDQLIIRIGKSDHDAFTELYTRTSSSVYGFALSILKNAHEAEDVMQEVFIKIYRSADTYQPQGKAMAWVLKITKNLCMNKLRSVEHHEDIDDLQHLIAEKDGINTNGAILEEAMKVLEETERQIVVLHAMTGMKHREIADILQIPLSTCLSKYNRSLKKMRHEIEKMEVMA